MAQYGSKIDQYADKPLASDQLYSNTNRDDPAMQAAAARRKLDSRAYKSAVADSKSRDPRVRAMGFKAASEMQATGYQPHTGIPGQGEFDGQDRKYADSHTRDGLVLEEQARKRAEAELGGKSSPVSPQAPPSLGGATPAGGAENPFVTGSGYKQGSEVAATTPAPSAGQGATPPAATPSAPSGAPVNGKPAATDWRTQRAIALDALKGKFTKQDAANALADKAAPQGIDPKYQTSKETLDMESKFDALIVDRPADQKAMFSKMSEKEKATMVQKNESLKVIREKEAKLGPDKSVNVKLADALQDNHTMTPEGEAASARDAASIAYGEKAVADATAAEPDIASRDKHFANKGAVIESEYQADRDYVAQVAEDRNLWFEDVKRNSNDTTAFGGIKSAFTGYRQDAPMPEADIYGVSEKRKADPDFKPDRYKSQYDQNGDFTGDKIGNAFIRDSKGNLNFESRAWIDGKKRQASNDQASNQIKQQKDNFYNGQINSVLEHSSFLQRYAV